MKLATGVFAIVLLTISALPAHAELTSTVKVRVRNSSNYVYPCNAGIAANPRSANKGVDYIRGSWVASENNPRASSGDGIAVAGSTGNSVNPDTDRAVLAALFASSTRPYLSYNQLLPEATQYDYVIGQTNKNQRFDVNLATDTYDSGFYVTFCFKPSLLDQQTDGVQETLKFVSARITHSVVPGSPYNYATESGLKAMLEIKCTKGGGKIVQHYTPGGNTVIDTLLTSFPTGTTVDLAPSGGIVIGDGNSLISGSTLNPGDLPDDCRVRFYFIETSGKLRPHVLSSSDIQIDIDAQVGLLGG